MSLGNNVAVPALFAGLLGKTNSWLECLQSNGALLQHPVCSRGRPSPLENNGELTRSAFWGRVFDTRGDEDEFSDSLTDAFPLTRNLGATPPGPSPASAALPPRAGTGVRAVVWGQTLRIRRDS